MARRGVLRRVMRGYIEFLQPRADRLSKQLETRWLKLRAQAIKETQGAHKRAPEALAHIMLGYSMMQDYLVSVGAMTDEEANADFLDAWRVLVENSTEQGKEAREERPSKRFISAISELLVNQTVTVKDLSIHSATAEKGMIGYGGCGLLLSASRNVLYNCFQAVQRSGDDLSAIQAAFVSTAQG